jgi:arsenate reductase
MRKRILILCTGNSCRSQMAEGFMRSFGGDADLFSAGTAPAPRISQRAVQVMEEAGIDIRTQYPKPVEKFLGEEFDYVITVCDHAKETCPVFTRKVVHHLHIGFDDPASATGSSEEVLSVFRRVRDEIRIRFLAFHEEHIMDNSEWGT